MTGQLNLSLGGKFPIFCFQQRLNSALIQLSAGRVLKIIFHDRSLYDSTYNLEAVKALTGIRKVHPFLPLFILNEAFQN